MTLKLDENITKLLRALLISNFSRSEQRLQVINVVEHSTEMEFSISSQKTLQSRMQPQMNQRPVPSLSSFITRTPNLSALLGRKLCASYSNKYGK